jgi:hypothetical protein
VTSAEDYLTRMVSDQRAFQERVDRRPFSGDVTQRIAYVKDMYVALVQEAGEFLDETTWKPWTTATPAIHSAGVMAELTDAWCFLCNVWFAIMPHATPAEIAQAMYISHDVKVHVNHRRQDASYDGTNKCPICERAFDEPDSLGFVVENRVAMCLACRGTWPANRSS